MNPLLFKVYSLIKGYWALWVENPNTQREISNPKSEALYKPQVLRPITPEAPYNINFSV